MLFRSIIFTVYLTAFVQSAAILSRESESAARQAPPSLLPIAGNETDPQIPKRRRLYSSGPSGSRSRTHLREDFYAGRREPTKTMIRRAAGGRATPAPTGEASADTTVHISSESDFALLLPERDGELISEAESDGSAYCTPGSGDGTCSKFLSDGFILAAAFKTAEDNSYIQVTGCMDPSKFHFAQDDDGGQFDVRFPNGAQCTFGGYAASFIEQVEPSASRFCLRCCKSADDQTNCDSHEDKSGCLVAVPGTYDFPDRGVSCG